MWVIPIVSPFLRNQVKNAASSPGRARDKPQRDCGGTEHDDGTREEHRPNSRNAADEPQRRTGDSERQVEKCGVRAHREPPALRRRTLDGFHAKAGVDERVPEAGECSPDQRQADQGAAQSSP